METDSLLRHNKPGKRAFVLDLYIYRFYKQAFVPDLYLYRSYKLSFVPDLYLVATGFVSWHLYQMETDSLLSQNKPSKGALVPDLYLVTTGSVSGHLYQMETDSSLCYIRTNQVIWRMY